MNKNALAGMVATQTGMAKKDALRAVEEMLSAIVDALRTGEDVRLVGFGTFSVINRAAADGRNPRTGDTIHIESSRLPRFRASKALKEAVN